MAKESSTALILKTMLNEFVKTYIVLDGQGRQHLVYQAKANAKHGEICLVTENVYNGPASTVIIAVKEAEGVWDGSWDSNFTI